MTALDQLADELKPRRAAIQRAIDMRMNDLAPDRFGPTQAQLVIEALWPHALPHECGHGEWWRTDLGRLVAGSLAQALATNGDEAVTHATVAEILGIQRGAVGQYLTKGYVQRATVGEGVSLASVLARVAR